MVICENWAVEPQRAAAFFRAHARPADGGFLWGGCTVTLTAQTHLLLGRWPTERTVIRLEGPDEEVKDVYRRFQLQFLSAGG